MVGMKQRTRSAYVYSDDAGGIVHLPDLAVPDHDKLNVGFLSDRHQASPKPLPSHFDRWREFRGRKRND
jgi:hypothetical protein